MLNDKANPASEITALRSRIVTLESDNAALTNERDAVFNEGLQSIRQLAAAQATNVKLREALAHAIDVMKDGQRESPFCEKVLALPNDTTALDARLAQERKEIADTCDRFHERGMTPAECAAHIRSMT